MSATSPASGAPLRDYAGTPSSAVSTPVGATESVDELYSELTQLIERLHRRFLDVLRIELERLEIQDINAVQALLVADLTEEVSVGDLVRRAYYLGSSVNYNIKKLVENGYLVQERSAHDRRSMRVRLSDKGQALSDKIRALQANQAATLMGGDSSKAEYDSVFRSLRRLEQAWSDYVQFGQLNTL
jgi:DNA-binding MarR family transcriptional regulator